ncbi:MAG: hypothetical protein WAK31_05840 [Chthoniobacterales bacterium]
MRHQTRAVADAASVQPMEMSNLPLLGAPQQTERRFYRLDRGVAKEVISTADDKCWLPFKASAIVSLSKKGVGLGYES